MNRLCLYAHYDESNVLNEDDLKTLNLLSKEFDKIIIITSNTIHSNDYEIYFCENKGLDFGKHEWFIKNNLDAIRKYDNICLTNNSYIGCRDFKHSIEYMNKKTCDWWGYTSSNEIKLHVQSYFLYFKNKSFYSFVDFLFKISPYDNNLSYRSVIDLIELEILDYMSYNGYKADTYLKTHLIFPTNSTILHADKLLFLNENFPLFKKNSYIKNTFNKEKLLKISEE